MDALEISVEHPQSADVHGLLLRHFELMRSQSPAESCHVLKPDALLDTGATLLGLRRDGNLLGVGALAEIGVYHGELKSMHTAAEARGQGVARKLLSALLALGASNGMNRISLETGTAEAFAPARILYTSQGFSTCPPFGSYTPDPLSVFMTKRL